MKSSKPLIELAEGRSQDKRSDLLAAFRRVVNQSKRRQVTDLHVRELLTYVLANDFDGKGVQKSIAELANDILIVPESTCRNIVDRAVEHFQLLIVTDERNARGGQDPNRHKINWVRVRTLNGASVECRPGATTDHPPDTIGQPPDTTYQPTDPNSSLTCSLQETTTTSALRTPRRAAGNDPWQVVVVSLGGILAKADAAIQGAKRLGYGPDQCQVLIDHWKNSEYRSNPGVLYRWLTMARSAPAELKPKTRYVDQQLLREQARDAAVIAKRREMMAANGGQPLTRLQVEHLEEFAKRYE